MATSELARRLMWTHLVALPTARYHCSNCGKLAPIQSLVNVLKNNFSIESYVFTDIRGVPYCWPCYVLPEHTSRFAGIVCPQCEEERVHYPEKRGNGP